MKMKQFSVVALVVFLVILFASCVNNPAILTPVDTPAPEIYFENNFGFNYVHYPKAEPSGTVFPAEWFGDSYGFITSPSNQEIVNAVLEVFEVVGGRDVPSSHTSVYGPIDLVLTGGCHFDHDWTETFVALPAGKYELRVTATDALGKSNYKELTFYVHDIFLQDTKGNNISHTPEENILVNVLGLTGEITFALYDSGYSLIDPQPALVGNQIQIGTLPQGGYNLFVESANNVKENYWYSFYVTDATGPSIAFYTNAESGNTSYTGDGYLEWRIANYGPQDVQELLYRESSHSRQMMFNPIYNLYLGGLPANRLVTITSEWFTINDQRTKIDVVATDAQGNCSAPITQYFIYKGASSEFLYLNNTSYDETVYPGDVVTLELELKNVKDFGALYTWLEFYPVLVPVDELTITFPSIKGTADKTELNAVNVDDYGFFYYLELMKAVVDLPGGIAEAFTGNGIFARISFTVPDDAVAGYYDVSLLHTLIRDNNNHEKGEVRDDIVTYILVGDR
jgi:hypothetical protein